MKTKSYQEILSIFKDEIPLIRIEENPGKKLKWGNKVPTPFYYGEIKNFINPADNMGWDIIIPWNIDPKTKNLDIAAVVKISDNADKIPPPNGNKPGNHKLILGIDGRLSNEQLTVLKEWFKGMKIFEKFEILNQNENDIYSKTLKAKKMLEENWEKSIFGKYKLGHIDPTKTGYTGIAVGGVAKRNYGLKESIEQMNKLEKILIESIETEFNKPLVLDKK